MAIFFGHYATSAFDAATTDDEGAPAHYATGQYFPELRQPYSRARVAILSPMPRFAELIYASFELGAPGSQHNSR